MDKGVQTLTVTPGSMLNAMQFFPSWKAFFNEPAGSRLGLLSAMYSIGSIASLPFVPILSDNFGRRLPIIVGCCIMIIAASVQVSNFPMPCRRVAKD